MVEWREVEPHFGLGRSDPPAQLEEWHQAFPPTRLIALPKIVIADPHAQISQSYFQQRHDLVFGVIEFPHFAFARLEVFSAFAGHVEGLDRIVHSGSARVFSPRWWLRARRVGDALPTRPLTAGL